MVNIIDIIKTAINKVISLNSTKLTKDKFKEIFCTVRDLPISARAASKWTINSSGAYLCGTQLRFNFSATRSSKTDAGNITNEDIGTFTIIHDGRLKNLYGITSRSIGVIATVELGVAIVDSNTITVTPRLSATHAALTSISVMDIMPASIDVSKY
ncbi:MAG: hypothetical protein ACI4W0_05705 [Bacilli bacterium]